MKDNPVTKSRDGSEDVLIFTRRGRDGEIAGSLLSQAGFNSLICPDLPMLCARIKSGAGLAILAEEWFASSDLRPLANMLVQQPPWSDFPFIVLTHRGGGLERNPRAGRLAAALGNVTFLERPFHPTTLVSVVNTALRGRRRQYEARARMMELEGERRALADLTASLEERVAGRTTQLLAEVSAREKAQAQLFHAQKVESLGQLTGGVAHDFNNLLMAVMGNLDLLRKRCLQDERALRLINSAMQGAKRGAALTQRMLAFARQQTLQTSAVDLGAMVNGMRSLIEQAISPVNELVIDIAPNLPAAKADANQLELAVLNLCINARDAMAEGGIINICVCLGDSDEATGMRFLRLAVRDTGEGMDEETLKKAVEPFFSTKPIGKGTGLGLSSVHGLASQLGGRFELESTPGKGTTATLWLPCADQALKSQTGTGECEARSMHPRSVRILVVDDDPLIANSTVEMLEDLGHTVAEANSARAALEMIDSGHPLDLLITDHIMPGMTGLELAQVVREKYPDLPILLTTGYAELPSGSQIRIPRLSKPYQQRELDDQINRMFPEEVSV